MAEEEIMYRRGENNIQVEKGETERKRQGNSPYLLGAAQLKEGGRFQWGMATPPTDSERPLALVITCH